MTIYYPAGKNSKEPLKDCKDYLYNNIQKYKTEDLIQSVKIPIEQKYYSLNYSNVYFSGFKYPDSTTLVLQGPTLEEGTTALCSPSFGLTKYSLNISIANNNIGDTYIIFPSDNEEDTDNAASIDITGVDGDGYVTGYKVNNPGSNFTNNSNIICSKININNEDSFLDSIENTINDIVLINDQFCISKIIINNEGSGYELFNNDQLIKQYIVQTANSGSGNGFYGTLESKFYSVLNFIDTVQTKKISRTRPEYIDKFNNVISPINTQQSAVFQTIDYSPTESVLAAQSFNLDSQFRMLSDPNCDPVCIPQSSFFEPGTTGGGCGNPPTIYGEQTISIPSGLTAPVYVELIGGADDLLIIDGEVVDAGQIDNGFGCLVSAGNYAFVLNSPSFTIAAGDTVGGNAGYTYQICFYNPECFPSPTPTPSPSESPCPVTDGLLIMSLAVLPPSFAFLDDIDNSDNFKDIFGKTINSALKSALSNMEYNFKIYLKTTAENRQGLTHFLNVYIKSLMKYSISNLPDPKCEINIASFTASVVQGILKRHEIKQLLMNKLGKMFRQNLDFFGTRYPGSPMANGQIPSPQVMSKVLEKVNRVVTAAILDKLNEIKNIDAIDAGTVILDPECKKIDKRSALARLLDRLKKTNTTTKGVVCLGGVGKKVMKKIIPVVALYLLIQALSRAETLADVGAAVTEFVVPLPTDWFRGEGGVELIDLNNLPEITKKELEAKIIDLLIKYSINQDSPDIFRAELNFLLENYLSLSDLNKQTILENIINDYNDNKGNIFNLEKLQMLEKNMKEIEKQLDIFEFTNKQLEDVFDQVYGSQDPCACPSNWSESQTRFEELTRNIFNNYNNNLLQPNLIQIPVDENNNILEPEIIDESQKKQYNDLDMYK